MPINSQLNNSWRLAISKVSKLTALVKGEAGVGSRVRWGTRKGEEERGGGRVTVFEKEGVINEAGVGTSIGGRVGYLPNQTAFSARNDFFLRTHK